MPSELNGISTVNSIPAAPVGYKFYFHGMVDIPGVATANNFLSVFNPVGSGKTLVFYQAIISGYAGAAATSANSLQIFRTTAASGGSLVAAANVNRFVTTDPNPVAEVRTDNPSTTNSGSVILGFAPPITTGSGGSATAQSSIPPGAGFVCLPGQGVVYGTAAGDTDQLWNINVLWAEV